MVTAWCAVHDLRSVVTAWSAVVPDLSMVTAWSAVVPDLVWSQLIVLGHILSMVSLRLVIVVKCGECWCYKVVNFHDDYTVV